MRKKKTVMFFDLNVPGNKQTHTHDTRDAVSMALTLGYDGVAYNNYGVCLFVCVIGV